MAVIGNLVANLVADTSGFTRPMIAASAVVGNVSSSVASAAATAAGGFGKLATSSAKASVDVSRGMSNIIKAVGAATGSMGVGLAKAVAVTRESGAKVAAIQAKTEAQLARQQARMMKGAVSGGVLSGLAKFTAITYALKGLTSSFAGMVSGAIDAQKSGAKLDAVLASTGGAAGVSGDEIRKLAGDLQLVTDFEDDATIAAAGVLATFTQVKGDVFKDAIVSAQNLSAVMGQDLQSSVVQIGKALNDPVKGIQALSRVGVSFTQQQKDQIAAMVKAGNVAGAQAIILKELQTEFGGAAEAMSSPFTRIGNIVGDVAEGIGAVFLPTLESVASMITAAIVPAAEGMGEKFAAAGSSLKSVVVPAVQMAIAIVSNLGTALELFGARVNLAMVQTANQVSYVFTEKLPAIIAWFFDNWGAFWRDLVEIQRAQLRNMLLNIGDNIAMIIEYIQSGGTTEWKFVWTPLTDGFQSTMSKLPKIAERVPSQLEKALGGMVSDLEGKLTDDMATTMEGLQAEVDKKPLTPTIKPPPSGDTVTPTKTQAVGAAQAGTREALSAIFSSMRGADLQAEMLAIQERQLQTQQEQLDALNGLNENQGVEIEP